MSGVDVLSIPALVSFFFFFCRPSCPKVEGTGKMLAKPNAAKSKKWFRISGLNCGLGTLAGLFDCADRPTGVRTVSQITNAREGS